MISSMSEIHQLPAKKKKRKIQAQQKYSSRMEKLCACCEALRPQECTWRARAPTAACQPSPLSPVSSHWPAWLTSPVAAPPAKSVHAAGSAPSPVCTAMHLGQDLEATSACPEPGALQLIVCLESALAHNLFLFFPLHTMVYFFPDLSSSHHFFLCLCLISW